MDLNRINKINNLRHKLDHYSQRVLIRYAQYAMKKRAYEPINTMSQEMRMMYRSVLGWCTKAVDSLADRLIVREIAGKTEEVFGVNDIFKKNNADILFDSAITSALIASCSFFYLSLGEDGYPRIQVIEANNATGTIDPITGLLKEGYAVLERDENGKAIVEAYFEPYATWIIAGEKWEKIENNVSYPLLVPLIHRPDAVRPFGRSRISRSAEYYQDYAKRTLERSDVTAEFYSFPQKYILGMEADAERMLDTWKATVSSMLRIDKDSEGDKPSVGQFSSVSMSPFMEQLRMAASGFAGETGLTLDDLGYVSDNPTSAEAIKASHETLRLMAKKAQRCFASGIINTALVACSIRDDYTYSRTHFADLKVKWEPVFAPDTSTFALIGDGAYKINQVIPNYIDAEILKDMGIGQ